MAMKMRDLGICGVVVYKCKYVIINYIQRIINIAGLEITRGYMLTECKTQEYTCNYSITHKCVFSDVIFS